MFGPAYRSVARAPSLLSSTSTTYCSVLARRQLQRLPAKRFLTTASKPGPKGKPSTWKGTIARWATAGALVYWYNTSAVFADEPASSRIGTHKTPNAAEQPDIKTILSQRRHQSSTESEPSHPTSDSHDPAGDSEAAQQQQPEGNPDLLTPGELEEEAQHQGAFNEETGEINWDCPCLGGMAHGPCGEDFKAAFSCFVYSKEEPKGMDCIEKFKAMQDCFREHPEIYGSELEEEQLETELAEGDVKQQVKEATLAEAPETVNIAPGEPPVAPLSSVQDVQQDKAARTVEGN